MSLYYQRIAIWVCGICPTCREKSVECEHIGGQVSNEMFGDYYLEGTHRYTCELCTNSQIVEPYMYRMAYNATRHWGPEPKYGDAYGR